MNVAAPGSAYVWWLRPRDVAPGALDAFLDDADRRALAEASDLAQRGSQRCARALLRAVAAHLLGQNPEDVTVARRCDRCGSRDHGRPVVERAPFVLSVGTTPGAAAVAVANHRVGVELLARADAELAIEAAPVVLPDSAVEVLDTLPGELRPEAALVATAQVEAYAKAACFALSSVARSVSVSLVPSHPQVVTAHHEWFACRVDPDEHHVGVLVTEAAPSAVRVGNAARLFMEPTYHLRGA